MRKFLFPEYEIYSSDESFNITIENSLNPAKIYSPTYQGYDEKGKLLSNLREKKMNVIKSLCKTKMHIFS